MQLYLWRELGKIRLYRSWESFLERRLAPIWMFDVHPLLYIILPFLMLTTHIRYPYQRIYSTNRCMIGTIPRYPIKNGYDPFLGTKFMSKWTENYWTLERCMASVLNDRSKISYNLLFSTSVIHFHMGHAFEHYHCLNRNTTRTHILYTTLLATLLSIYYIFDVIDHPHLLKSRIWAEKSNRNLNQCCCCTVLQ